MTSLPTLQEKAMRSTTVLAAFAGGLLMFGLHDAAGEPIKYPGAHRGNQVDTYHDVKVADPYRWLEDDVRKSAEVKAWVDAENKITAAFLNGIPERESIQKRLTEIWNYEKYTAPSRVAGRYFYRKNDGLQNQSVLYTLDQLDDEPKVLIDPNTWSKDGTISLEGTSVSPDAKSLAYAVSEAGSDWQTWKVMEIASGKIFSDELKWVKFSGASWTA